jgi:putative heme-binding domain-containing protein
MFEVGFIDKDNPHWSLPRRQIAIRLLPHLDDEKALDLLKGLVETETDQALRSTALESLASLRRPDVDAWLLQRYPAETPVIRRAILSALFASKERQLALLGAIEEGKIAATEIDPVRAKQLTESKDEAVREKAKQVLAAAAPASRKEVLEAYQPALTLKGDPQRGREVFQKNCVTCHRVGDLGVNVAPDISDTRTKKPEQLLLDILAPNRAIDANYFAYAVVTKDGKTESGVIASESSSSITLKQPEGKTLTLLRSDIEELRNTGISLMPVGVEKNINQQQMADLIFWLKNWRYLDGKVPATSLK